MANGRQVSCPRNYPRIGPQYLYACAFAAIIVINAEAADDEVLMQDWIIERADLSHAVNKHQAVTIVNSYGDIRARGGDDDQAAVHAVIQRHKDDTETPEIMFHSEKNRLTIKVTYPDRTGQVMPEAFAKRRTDIAVFVPSAIELTLTTLDGRAESKGHKGRLVIHSRAGKIVAATTGSVDAHSDSGKVKVEFRNRIWSGPSALETISGDISVFLMSDPHVAVDIDTAGTITSDYSIDISPVPGSSRKIARAVIGEAEHELDINTAVGAVRLGRIFDMIPASSPVIEADPANETDGPPRKAEQADAP